MVNETKIDAKSMRKSWKAAKKADDFEKNAVKGKKDYGPDLEKLAKCWDDVMSAAFKIKSAAKEVDSAIKKLDVVNDKLKKTHGHYTDLARSDAANYPEVLKTLSDHGEVLNRMQRTREKIVDRIKVWL